MTDRNPDRIFFPVTAAWFVIMTIVGFGPSLVFGYEDQGIPLPIVIHAVVFVSWVILYAAQTSLIATSRIRYHRFLGVCAVAIFIALIPTGLMPVLYKVSIGTKTISHAGFNIVGLALGLAFVAAGFLNRKTAYAHKRLMLFGTLVLCIAAADRASFVIGYVVGIEEDIRLFRKLLAVVPGIALVAYDVWRARRVPKLAMSLLAVVWVLIYFNPLAFIFHEPIGESFVLGLVEVFGY